MSNRKTQRDAAADKHATAEPDAKTEFPFRVLRFFSKLRAWAAVHWLRSLLVAGTILLLIAATMAGWAYLANLALRSGELTIDAALVALDEGRYEQARAAVRRMLQNGRFPRSKYGGPLYVLGAIKTHDAEEQSGSDRRRIEYLVASRYLNEAQAYGLPPGRERDGLFLLGKSLVESGQYADGIRALDELLNDQALPADSPLAWEAHRLLSNTCLLMPQPNIEKALKHTQFLVAKTDIPEPLRGGALLQLAECLTRLERFDDARQALAQVPSGAHREPEVALMQARISLDEINAVLARIAPPDHSGLLDSSRPKVVNAIKQLEEAQARDEQKGQVTRQASYRLGQALLLQGDADLAVKQFARTRQLYGETFEGLAAALAEADLLRESGDLEGALIGYRRVLESYDDLGSYRSIILPLAKLRERLMIALKDFVTQKRFADAITLIERFPPLFSRREQLEMRGGTLEQWGEYLIQNSTGHDSKSEQGRAAGRRYLRAAGLAREQLAELRFATRQYSDDLWQSADNYFRGHSFSSTVRLLTKYLENEPELRNPEALLRLGQAHLALRQTARSIAAFEECIEFHPLSSSTFQARVDCAKACWMEGNVARAEQLLRDNLTAQALRPISREWKDSLFELGMLLHEMGRYEEAIGTLEHAIERYPQDPQRLASQYVIGESYRRWAQELVDRSSEVHTESERSKNKETVNERLTAALAQFAEVQRTITLKTHDLHQDRLMGTMLRNCYMLEGAVLFDLGRYKEAIEAYSNVASLYPDEPFVLETFVQIANCWRRLGFSDKALGSIEQAQIALERLPPDADFTASTVLNRDEWQALLADMSRW